MTNGGFGVLVSNMKRLKELFGLLLFVFGHDAVPHVRESAHLVQAFPVCDDPLFMGGMLVKRQGFGKGVLGKMLYPPVLSWFVIVSWYDENGMVF